MRDITKKKFQEMLNAWDRDARSTKQANQHGNIVDGWKNGRFHQSKRLYGDYLRAQDPNMFDDMYHRYITGYDQQDLNEYL